MFVMFLCAAHCSCNFVQTYSELVAHGVLKLMSNLPTLCSLLGKRRN